MCGTWTSRVSVRIESNCWCWRIGALMWRTPTPLMSENILCNEHTEYQWGDTKIVDGHSELTINWEFGCTWKKCTIQSHFGKCPTSEWLCLLNLTLKSLSTSISFQFINILRCTSCRFIRSKRWFPPPHGLKDPGFQTLLLGGSATLTRWNAGMAVRTGCQAWLAHIAFESPSQNEV